MEAALHGAKSLSTFWVACPRDYSTLKTLAMYVLTMFISTYAWESALSKVKTTNTDDRNQLSNQSLEL